MNSYKILPKMLNSYETLKNNLFNNNLIIIIRVKFDNIITKICAWDTHFIISVGHNFLKKYIFRSMKHRYLDIRRKNYRENQN